MYIIGWKDSIVLFYSYADDGISRLSFSNKTEDIRGIFSSK